MEVSSISVSFGLPKPAPSFSPSFSQTSFYGTNCFWNKTKPNCKALVLGRSRFGSGTGRARKGLTCNALFGLGVPELVVIAGVAALVFGPKKLPEVGKSIGKTVKSFQQAAKEFESELKKEPEAIAETPVDKKTLAVSDEEKPDAKVPSSKEGV